MMKFYGTFEKREPCLKAISYCLPVSIPEPICNAPACSWTLAVRRDFVKLSPKN